MIAALAFAGATFERPDWIALAARAFAFVTTTMARGGRLAHSWRDGKSVFPGLATDYAAMIKAALALHAATLDPPTSTRPKRLPRPSAVIIGTPTEPGYFLSADDAEALIIRPKATTDEATPSATGLMAQNLIRLWRLTGKDDYRDDADASSPPMPVPSPGTCSAPPACSTRSTSASPPSIWSSSRRPTGDAGAIVAARAGGLDAEHRPLRARRCGDLPAGHPGAAAKPPSTASRPPTSAAARPARCRSPGPSRLSHRWLSVPLCRGSDGGGSRIIERVRLRQRFVHAPGRHLGTDNRRRAASAAAPERLQRRFVERLAVVWRTNPIETGPHARGPAARVHVLIGGDVAFKPTAVAHRPTPRPAPAASPC